MDLFRRIVDEAGTIPQITEITLTGLSESLLDPHLVERVAYTRKACPKAFIYAYTNGTYLTEQKFLELQDAGLDMLLVSLNAADAETRKRVMGLDDFEKVVAALMACMRVETTCKVRVRAVTNRDSFTHEDAQDLYRLWGVEGEGGRVMTVREGNWAGDTETKRDFQPNECCNRALGMVYVTYDGRVTPCCFDPFAKMAFGDLNKQTLREVYNSEAYVQFRDDHAADRADKYEVCKGCTRI